MTTEILGSVTYLEAPTVNGSPVLLNITNSGSVLQSSTSAVAATSGTSTYTLANTTPTTASGSLIWTGTFTPSSATSRVNILGSMAVSHGTAARTVIAMLFRGTTCISVSCQYLPTASTLNILSFNVTDSPASISTQTYTLRVAGSGNGTWYVGQTSTAYFNGLLAQNDILMQELS